MIPRVAKLPWAGHQNPCRDYKLQIFAAASLVCAEMCVKGGQWLKVEGGEVLDHFVKMVSC